MQKGLLFHFGKNHRKWRQEDIDPNAGRICPIGQRQVPSASLTKLVTSLRRKQFFLLFVIESKWKRWISWSQK